MSEEPLRSHPPSHRGRRLLRSAIPFLVSGALLAYLFARIDVRLALDYVSWKILGRFLLALVLSNIVTLAIESHCLHLVARAHGAPLDHANAARIKAACYLLSLLNYGLGAAGLSLLLRRHARVGLGEAASMVFLISLLDIGSVLALVTLGAGFLQVDALGVRLGLVGLFLAAIVAGFVFLRAPIRLGPLDRIRDLDFFMAPRHASLALLAGLGLLRLLFVGSYVALAAALFWAYEIDVEPVRLAMNVGIMLVVSALPIAAGGLGTGQLVFVELFSGLAPDAELLSASLVFSLGLLASRAALGLFFAPEFTREVLVATRSEASPLALSTRGGRSTELEAPE